MHQLVQNHWAAHSQLLLHSRYSQIQLNRQKKEGLYYFIRLLNLTNPSPTTHKTAQQPSNTVCALVRISHIWCCSTC